MNGAPDSSIVDSPSTSPPAQSEIVRPCLACGYDLQGLGEEPRCPECGLLNIPEGYRRQVWELVDSGKWFFSSFFGAIRKRPPGWWWSLDRPGDLRRASKTACAFLALGVFIIVSFGLICGSIVRRETTVWIYPQTRDANVARQAYYRSYDAIFRLGHTDHLNESYMITIPAGPAPQIRKTAVNSFDFSWHAVIPTLFVAGLLITLWLIPSTVGLCTQIRKSLPAFAHPPRTIWAASLYEAHRIVYVAAFISLLMSVDVYFRCNGWTLGGHWAESTWPLISVVAAGFAMLGWVGPLRSDYTNQLIRSRGHAIRILIMYCLAFPLIITGSLAFFYNTRGL